MNRPARSAAITGAAARIVSCVEGRKSVLSPLAGEVARSAGEGAHKPPSQSLQTSRKRIDVLRYGGGLKHFAVKESFIGKVQCFIGGGEGK